MLFVLHFILHACFSDITSESQAAAKLTKGPGCFSYGHESSKALSNDQCLFSWLSAALVSDRVSMHQVFSLFEDRAAKDNILITCSFHV